MAAPVNDKEHAHVVHGDVRHSHIHAARQHDAMSIDAPQLQAQQRTRHLSPSFQWGLLYITVHAQHESMLRAGLLRHAG